MKKSVLYGVGVLLLSAVVFGILLAPQQSPANELPPVSEPPLKKAENTDVRQVINLTYYDEGDRTVINDTLIYDADTQRGYSVVNATQLNKQGNDPISEHKAKYHYYVEPDPNSNNVRVYSWNSADNYPPGVELREEIKQRAANDSTRDVAFNEDGEFYQYRLYGEADYIKNNTTPGEALSEESRGEASYLAYSSINENPDIPSIHSETSSPNYTTDGTTVTRNGIVYTRYTAHNAWTTQQEEPITSAYAANGTVLYNETVGYGYADVSYNSVKGNALLDRLAQQGTIAISKLLPSGIDTETEGRIGIDVRYNATIKNGTVEDTDVPCPEWTKRVGPTPSCHNTTA